MRLWYRFGRVICQTLYTFVCRGRVFGCRNVPVTGGVLLVCNHQSFFDPVLATLALPRECHYMARHTLFRNAFFRRVIESLNAFPIRPGTADVGAIKETLRRLKRGALITAFPEGTRTPDGLVHAMQSGVVLIARKARVPIVPTLILGAFESWPRQARVPQPRPIIVAYGRPLWPAEMVGVDDEQCIGVVHERVVRMMERYRRHPLVAGRLRPLPASG
jgi:1-acyl-sn-glycerol-3-phosphate acyltransferase